MDSLTGNAEFSWVKETIKNFEDVKIDHIAKLGEGMMNRTYLINQKFVFRFPKEKQGAFDTEKEKRVLPLLKKHITLNIPEFIYCGKQDNGYPFAGYRILPGEPMNEQLFHSLSVEIKNRIADQIAEFINEIQSFNVEKAKELNIQESNFYQDYLEIFQEVQEKVFPKINKEMQAYISIRFTSFLENKNHFLYTSNLLHSDLSLDHLLFDKKKQELTGIIDFGDMRIGDSDYEYIYLLEECGKEFTTKVMERRKEDNIQYKLKKVSYFLTADNVMLLLDGIKRNNAEMMEEAIKAIQYEMNKHYS
ncbi:aminoglycoside phosphotransferase [Mesobacillus campisalis]|uniref:Aminoglycoside phosphotransferase n=2 Tax=Mesobacillus campisalis TaxID=1408103 RepID=A0A0M2SZU4_9BACI|nr:aminoglycoside phosphotransferase [Mesobacillus campisalis]